VLQDFPLLLDGGMGSALIERGLAPGQAPELWLIEQPQAISSVHRSFVDAGSDIIQTASFGANRARLAQHDQLAGRTVELCTLAAKLAREVVDARPDPKRGVLVAGNIGPAFAWLDSDSPDEGQLSEIFAEAALALADAGVDLISIETMCDVREARAAVLGAQQSGLPVIASMTFGQTQDGFQSLAGDNLEDCLNELETAGATAVGLNCNLDSRQARLLAMSALTVTELPLVVQPCAGQPTEKLGKLSYPETMASFADNQLALARAGIAIVGGCCGTSAASIATLRQNLDELKSAGRRRSSAD
jgi:5-methyltetrahydrofolate--homocysteine methyltransferase